MRLTFFKSPICLIAAVVILIVCILEITGAAAFKRLEWMTYDWRVRLAYNYANHAENDATNLGAVDVSDDSVAAVAAGLFGYTNGLYWPRAVYGRGLDELTKQGAKAVAFDVVFAERRPDQDQDEVDLPDGSSYPSDLYFAKELTNAGNVILAAGEGLLPDPFFRTNAWRTGSIATDEDPDGVLRRAPAVLEYRDWHWIVRQFAERLSFDLPATKVEPGRVIFYSKDKKQPPVVLSTDAQGMVDTTEVENPVKPDHPLKFLPFKPVRVWNMGIILAAAQLNLDLDHPDIDLPHHCITLHGPNGLTRVIPVDDKGSFYIDWSMGLNNVHLTEGPFEELLDAKMQRDAGHPVTNKWRDKLVVIGSTATGNDLADVGATPLQSVTHLFSMHWNVANSIISGRFITTTSRPVNLALIILIGVLAAWITWVPVRPLNGSLLMTAAAIIYVALAVTLFLRWRIWLPIVLPLACAGLITHLSALTYRVTVEQSERKRVKSLFSRLVSPEVVNKVLGGGAASINSLAGERRQITVLFADIRGFTELTDAAQAESTEFVRRNEMSAASAEDYFDEQAREVMKTVSLYLGTIADCVKKHNGTLDKYIGDCVMAFWGAPLGNPQHAVGAVRCAIDAQQALHALNLKRENENKDRERENFERLRTGEPMLSRLPVLSMGTGINTGMALAGFMGSEAHIVNYTVFGREVNLASRLEGLSGHGRIIIGEGTMFALQRDDPELAKNCAELPPKIVKGFRERVRMFEVRWQPPAPATAPEEPGKTRDNTPAVAS